LNSRPGWAGPGLRLVRQPRRHAGSPPPRACGWAGSGPTSRRRSTGFGRWARPADSPRQSPCWGRRASGSRAAT
jgi:hypothetical protein